MSIWLRTGCLCCFFLLILLPVYAQSFCGNTGGFSVTPTEGCAPLTVQVKNLVPKAENISYAYQFDRAQTAIPDISQTTQDSSYTYTKPGTYTILQFGSAGGTGFSQCTDIVVRETRGPNADFVKCPNGRALLTLISDSISLAYDAVEINWGDGTRDNVSISNENALYLEHFYAAGSAQPIVTLKGRYNSGACQTSATTTITKNTTDQSFQSIRIRNVEMLTGGEAKILYDGMENVPTEVFIDKGDGQFVSTGKTGKTGGIQSVAVSGLDAGQIYRFKLVSKDICDNPVESAVVSSIAIKEGALSLDEIISVAWQHHANTGRVIEYQLKRDGVVIFSTPDQLSYFDSDVKCENTYSYEIVAIIENDVRSYSAPFSAKPKSSPPGDILRASVTVKDEQSIITQVELSGEGLTTSYDLIVERAILGSSDFERVSQPGNQSLTFTDVNVNPSETSYCYRFEYENACKLKSPAFAQPICSIHLKNQSSNIVWNNDAPFTGQVSSYDVNKLDAQGNAEFIVPRNLETFYSVDLTAQSGFSFQVAAKSADGSFTSLSNILRIESDPILLVPDAFTPNGDAYNERFEVKGYFITDFKMSVFDRWGTVIYQSGDMSEGWDGRVNQKNANSGYYLYKIEAKDISGKTISKNGSFLLIR